MNYVTIADAYEKIEATTKRLEMTSLLVELLKATPKDMVSKVVYLTQGKIYPDFEGVEIGVAEKLAVKALARASGRTETEIEADLNKSGDVGETAEGFLFKKKQVTFGQRTLTVQRVYQTLDKISKTFIYSPLHSQ